MERKNVAPTNGQKPLAKGRAGDKPDPRPARLMLGAGALAAVTVVGAGLVDFPPAVAEEPLPAPAKAGVSKAEEVKRPVEYVRLKPGQKAPKGAKVIKEAAPTPRVVVQRLVVPAQSQTGRSVTRSRQSGG
jgi:hypothetical protein